MDNFTASYIVRYYSRLLSTTEQLILKHSFSIPILSADTIIKLHKELGWLENETTQTNIFENDIFGKDWYNENFKFIVAEQILKKHKKDVFLNNCPQCQKLARTPFAKQCRFCDYDWH